MNEDFVPFELAVKLKEKGFREKCLVYYDVEDNVGLLYNTQYTDEATPYQYTDLLQCHNTGEAESQIDDSDFCIDAPTISQVLKWLRKEKKIYCLPHFEQGIDMWLFCIERPQAGSEFAEYISESIYDTYEQAALAGIEYVLDKFDLVMPKLGNLFVARDINGSLFLYRCAPDVNKATGKYIAKTRGYSPQQFMSINPKLFPDLKFEDGAKEVELIMK